MSSVDFSRPEGSSTMNLPCLGLIAKATTPIPFQAPIKISSGRSLSLLAACRHSVASNHFASPSRNRPRPLKMALENGSSASFVTLASPAPLSDAELDSPRPIKSYARWITKRSAARQPSAIRALQPYLSIPGMVCFLLCSVVRVGWTRDLLLTRFWLVPLKISLGGGMPNPTMFPFDSMTVKLKDGTVLDIPSEEMAKGLQYSGTVS